MLILKGFFMTTFQPKKCFRYWKIIKREISKTTYRNLFQTIGNCLSVPMAGMINAALNLAAFRYT